MKILRACIAAWLVVASMGCLAQQGWPNRPVRIVIPYAAGGGVDAVARIVARALTGPLGQNVLVEAKPGGNTVIGADSVARAAPDGYTLLLTGGSTMSMLPLTQAKLPFDPLADFAPVGQVTRVPFFLAVPSAQPWKSVKDLFEDPKTKAGAYAYASNGVGSMAHLGTEMLLRKAGINLVHVPYNGFVPGVTDLATGRVVLMMADIGPLQAQLSAGALRLLAVASPNRSPFMPDVPTLAEAGYPGTEFEVWLAVYAPAKTPREIVARLAAELAKIMATPAIREELAKLAQDADFADADAVRARIAAEQKAFAPVVKAVNLGVN